MLIGVDVGRLVGVGCLVAAGCCRVLLGAVGWLLLVAVAWLVAWLVGWLVGFSVSWFLVFLLLSLCMWTRSHFIRAPSRRQKDPGCEWSQLQKERFGTHDQHSDDPWCWCPVTKGTLYITPSFVGMTVILQSI